MRVMTLAGKAVGASFSRAVAATLAVAEAVREVFGGQGTDVTTVNLDTLELSCVAATSGGDVILLPLSGLLARLRGSAVEHPERYFVGAALNSFVAVKITTEDDARPIRRSAGCSHRLRRCRRLKTGAVT